MGMLSDDLSHYLATLNALLNTQDILTYILPEC